ncbi:MAG TPA: LLM class F420-dependent oxidoreductase [Candidatus Binatia bacterium]|jgi:probable F420-dependent oxidoreductase
MKIGRIGIWHHLDALPASRAQHAAREVEELGYGALWIPEALGKEAFSHAGLLLAATRHLVVATGIANIWARDAMAMAAAQKTLGEAYPGRFLLGIGVSHQPLVQGLRGHDFRQPYAFMRQYLDAMDSSLYAGAAPASPPQRVLGALHPKMLALSAERADGAHTYFVTPEHTARTRRILGAGKLLAAEQAVVLDENPESARKIARLHMQTYLGLPNYVRNLESLGFGPADVADGGSDRLVDAIVAWGDVASVSRRIEQHLAAGADHVCIQALSASPDEVPVGQWRALAAVLIEKKNPDR